MAKNKARFTSLSTPDSKQDTSNYLTELVFLRRNKGIKLPPKFWQQTRYKFKYRREIQAVRKFIKRYGERRVLIAAISNYIETWTDYAGVEVILQKILESEDLKAMPKDTSPVSNVEPKPTIDLRSENEKLAQTPRKGLWEKLRGFNDVPLRD